MSLSFPCSKTAGRESFIDLQFDLLWLGGCSEVLMTSLSPASFLNVSINFQISQNIFYLLSTI